MEVHTIVSRNRRKEETTAHVGRILDYREINGGDTECIYLGRKMFENRVLRRTFGLKRDELTGGGENCIITCIFPKCN
jgi:hypothetical protein